MWPAFREGDLLIVKPIASGMIRCGDCIVYQRRGDGEAVVHRVANIRPELITRGDNMPRADAEAVKPEWILGRVTTCLRGNKSFRVRGGPLGGRRAWIVYILRKLARRLVRAVYMPLQRWPVNHPL